MTVATQEHPAKMSGMAEKARGKGNRTGRPKSPDRKAQLSVRINVDVLTALGRFCDEHPLGQQMTWVHVERAIRDYLEKNNFWPPPAKAD